MIDRDWAPLRTIGTYTRRSLTGTLIETYHDGYETNDAGAFIWSLVGSGRTVGDIADRVAAEYGLTPEYSDVVVREFVSELLARGFVTES